MTTLYHATDYSSACSIMSDQFYPSACGLAGPGVYFSGSVKAAVVECLKAAELRNYDRYCELLNYGVSVIQVHIPDFPDTQTIDFASSTQNYAWVYGSWFVHLNPKNVYAVSADNTHMIEIQQQFDNVDTSHYNPFNSAKAQAKRNKRHQVRKGNNKNRY